MPSATLPAAKDAAVASAAPIAGRRALASAAAVTLGWVLFLAVVTWRTANPPAINIVQILESDLVLVGSWQDRRAGRFEVLEELKHGGRTGLMTVAGAPCAKSPAETTWVVPVRREGTSWKVTQGRFANRPLEAHARDPDAPPPWIVQVEPQCYPATDDVLRQIRMLLERPAADAPP
jgi:hypothetical protein